MPHAWDHSDDEPSRSPNQQAFSLAGVAIASAVAGAVYFLLRRK